MPGGPIAIEPQYLPETEFEKREEKLRALMVEKELSALLIYGDEYRYGDYVYIANYKGLNIVEEAPYLIFFPLEGDSIMFSGGFNLGAARKYSRIRDVRRIWDLLEPANMHTRELSQLKLQRIGIVGSDIFPFTVYESLVKGLKNVELLRSDEIVEQLRVHKTAAEIELMKRAGEVGDVGLSKAREAIVEGESEWKVLAEAESAIRLAGGDNPFTNMMGSGEKLTDRIFLASDKKLKRGELVCVGVHPNFRFYCNDAERTWPLGEIPQGQMKVLKTMNKIMEETIAFIEPGKSWKDIVEYQKDLIVSEGYGKYWLQYYEEARGHALGHGTGLDMVEWPRRYPRDYGIVLEPNMTLAIKAEIHGFSWGGIRQETVVLVTQTGSTPLNKAEYI